MTFGSTEDGGGVLTLTPEEMTAFKAGKAVVKTTGDANGVAKITVKMTRPRRRDHRFPESTYGSDAYLEGIMRHGDNGKRLPTQSSPFLVNEKGEIGTWHAKQTKRLLSVQTQDGHYYYVNEKGEIGRRDMPFVASGQWLFLGLIRMQGRRRDYVPFEQLTPAKLVDFSLMFKNGKPMYRVVDLDHGSRRIWGNGVVALHWYDVPLEDLARERITI